MPTARCGATTWGPQRPDGMSQAGCASPALRAELDALFANQRRGCAIPVIRARWSTVNPPTNRLRQTPCTVAQRQHDALGAARGALGDPKLGQHTACRSP